jgi:hypothetical protein
MLPGVARVMVPETVLQEVPMAVVHVVNVIPVLHGFVPASLAVLVFAVILVRLVVQDVRDLSLLEGVRILEERSWELSHGNGLLVVGSRPS